MSRHKLHLVVACVVVTALHAELATAAARLDPTKTELMISLGATANAIRVDVGLGGIPTTQAEISWTDVFPVEPNKIVLGFPDTTFKSSAKNRMVVLTEDGLWGLAPLAEGDSPYFLRQQDIDRLRYLAAKDNLSWGIITRRIETIPSLALARDKLIPIFADSTGAQYVNLEYKPLYNDLSKLNPISSVSSTARISQLPIELFSGNFTLLDLDKFGEYLEDAARNANLDFSDRASLIQKYLSQGPSLLEVRAELFKVWRKALWLNQPYRIECTDTQTNKSSVNSAGSLSVQGGVKIPDIFGGLAKLGISFDSNVSFSKSWNESVETVRTLKSISLASDFLVLKAKIFPTILSIGNASTCGTPRERYFSVVVPNISESAVDISSMSEMGDLDKSITWIRQSGYLQVSCLSGYEKIIDYMINKVGLDESLARLAGSYFIRPDLRTFLNC